MSTRSLPLILVVDDESKIRRLLTKELEANGFDVVCAGDGEQALEVFAQSDPTPDLVLMDVMMPGMDGFECAERLSKSANVPIIFLSARNEPSFKLHGFDSGADDYITKPFLTEELIARIRAVMRRVRMAGHGLPLEGAAVARASRERHAIERGGIHVPPRIQQPLADGDGLGKRPGRILERRQHEVAQRVVASEREAVLERLGQRVVRVRSHCGDALAHVARRRDVGFLAQDAGGAAVVGHGDDGARIQAHGQKRAYGHGRAGAAADDDDAQALVARDDGLRFAQCGERSWENGRATMVAPLPACSGAGARRGVGALGQRQVAVRDAHAVALRLEVVGRGLGQRDAAVLAARASHGDGQLLFALGHVAGHDAIQKRAPLLLELLGEGICGAVQGCHHRRLIDVYI